MKTNNNFSRFSLVVLVLLSFITVLPLQRVTAEDTIKIGVLQTVEHEALDAVLKGFEETLNNSELADRVEINVQNASGDMVNLQSMS